MHWKHGTIQVRRLIVMLALAFLNKISGLYRPLNPKSKVQRNTLSSGLRSGLGGMRGA